MHSLLQHRPRDVAQGHLGRHANELAAHIHKARLEDINDVFAKLADGRVDGRMVLDFG